MCNSGLDFVLSARCSREVLQQLINSVTLPKPAEILLLNARLTEPFV
jgi:hypothetical protein